MRLRPRELLDVLLAHDLRFVVIGGVAERLLGSPRSTDDFDICSATSKANLARLATVLNELEARFRVEGAPEGFAPAVPWTARSFEAFTSLALITPLGFFDVWFRPEGTGGYDDLVRKAIDVEVGDVRIKVANLDDILRNKQAIGGPKYPSHLPLLRELRRARHEQGLP